MISPDLAETVKRLRERLAWSNRVEFQRPQGDGSTACKWEKPEALSSILDALEGLERALDDIYTAPDGREFSTVCAFNNYTQTKEIERLSAKATSLESSLAEARTGARTAEVAGNIAQEIVEIMTTYDEQDASGYVDTPGGLEHMGDVWDRALRDRVARILWDRENPISDEHWAALPDEDVSRYGEWETGKGDYLRDADAILAMLAASTGARGAVATPEVIEDVISDWLGSLPGGMAVGLRGKHAAALRDALIGAKQP